jgi:hypothetical protein
VNMISRAIVQSAIVLMNRRMNTERDVITFGPVCSRVTGMHLHHSQGMNRAQAKMTRVFSDESKKSDAIRTMIRSIACNMGVSLPETRKFSSQSQPMRVATASELLRRGRWSWQSSLHGRRWSWRSSLRRRKHCPARHLCLALLLAL